MSNLQTVDFTAASAEVPINENFETLDHQSVYGKRQPVTTGLTWGYCGGRWSGISIAQGTLTLTNAATNYVVVNRSTGAISVSSSSTNWNDTANYARVYQLTTAGSVVTAEQDHRAGLYGVHGQGGTGSASGVTVADAGNYFAGTNVETVLQEIGASLATAGKVPAQRYAIELANTTDSDPGAGLIKFDNAAPASATQLFIDDSSSDGVDLSTFFASLGQTGFIKIQSVADAGEWVIFKWTATVDGTGYWKFTVSTQASKGTLDDADDVLVEFDSDANTGGGGGTELKGLTFTSDTGSTADSDPGAGLFKWNNATQGSATKLFVDNATLDSITATTFFADLGGSAHLFIQQGDDSTRWQIWKITGATADSGYYDFDVSLLMKSTSDIQDDKTCYLDFTKTAAAASGSGTKTYATLTPMTSIPAATNQATLDARNGIPVLDFDDTTEESAAWVTVLPEGASLGSGLKFTIHFMCTSATSGNVRWGVRVEKMDATDLDSDSYDTAAEGHAAANGTSGRTSSVTITLTTIDSAVAQSPIRVSVYRDTSDTTNDTVNGDAELVCVEVWSAA